MNIKSDSNNTPEHAVVVRFKYGIDDLDALFELEDVLEKVITEKEVGEYDGHEIAMDYSDGTLYMYGPNADNLFKTVQPVLKEIEFMRGAKATLRFGRPEVGVKEITIEV
ncbi:MULTISPECIES: hypothetical protein [Niastella]|uniref:Uncharacterized protein n=1 Tax=Niastella soli TaxID=2821487 RepID=A0ABS3YZX3_9BACT|nr:hypothetical protein [Niastella soli]MBO9203379.1 hypothetical protein [Niastella soli]